MERHCADDAARHLRLVMLQLDAQHEKYAQWYRGGRRERRRSRRGYERTTRWSPAVRAEVRRVERGARLRSSRCEGLADLGSVLRGGGLGVCEAQTERVAKDSDARVADLRAENAALRTALSDKMTKDEMNAFVADASAFRETLEHETARAGMRWTVTGSGGSGTCPGSTRTSRTSERCATNASRRLTPRWLNTRLRDHLQSRRGGGGAARGQQRVRGRPRRAGTAAEGPGAALAGDNEALRGPRS